MGAHPMNKQELGPVPAPRHQVKFNPRTGGCHQPSNAIKTEGLQRQPCVTGGSLFVRVLLTHGSEPGYPLCSFLGVPFLACAVSPPLPQGMGFRGVVPGGTSGCCAGTSGTTSISHLTHGLFLKLPELGFQHWFARTLPHPEYFPPNPLSASFNGA